MPLIIDDFSIDVFNHDVDTRYTTHPTGTDDKFRWAAIGNALHGLKINDKRWLLGTNYYVYDDDITNRVSPFNGDTQKIRAAWKTPNSYVATRTQAAKDQDYANKVRFYDYELMPPANKGGDPNFTSPLVNNDFGGFHRYQSLNRKLNYLNWYYSPRVGVIYRIYEIDTGLVSGTLQRYITIKYQVQDALKRAENIKYQLKTFTHIFDSEPCGVLDYLNEGRYLRYNEYSNEYTYQVDGDRYIDNPYKLPYRLSSVSLDGSEGLLCFYQLCPYLNYHRKIDTATQNYKRFKIHQNEGLEASILAVLSIKISENQDKDGLNFAFDSPYKSYDERGSIEEEPYGITIYDAYGRPIGVDYRSPGILIRTDEFIQGNTRHLKYSETYMTGIITYTKANIAEREFEQLQYFDAVHDYHEDDKSTIILPFIYKNRPAYVYNTESNIPLDRTPKLQFGFEINKGTHIEKVLLFDEFVNTSKDIQTAIFNENGTYFSAHQHAFSRLASAIGFDYTRDGTGTINYRRFIYFFRICNYVWCKLEVKTHGVDEAVLSADDTAEFFVYNVFGDLLETKTYNNAQMQAEFGTDVPNYSQWFHEVEYIGQNVYIHPWYKLPSQMCCRYACLIEWFGSYDPVNHKWSGLQRTPVVWV